MNRSRHLRNYLITMGVFSSLVLAPGGAWGDTPRGGHSATGTKGMVVTVSRPASEVGLDVLKKGGNAVDAAVATAFALAVTWPEAGNIGGGGFMLVHPGGKNEPVFIDYRETAPSAATRRMFDTDRPISQYKLVGVPGTVRGLSLAHRRFGKLRWKDVVLPAVALAEEGFVIDKPLADSLNRGLRRARDFPELLKVYGKDGGKKPWQDGDRLVLKDLGRTLRRIAEDGPDSFYTGLTADLIDAEMRRGGGLITKVDLAGYRAKVRRPVHGTYRDFDIYASPPPSSGGTALVEIFNILEDFDLRRDGRWSARTLHLTIEATRRAYLDRARYLGDPDFVRIPDHLTTKEYARKLAKDIDLRKATPSASLAKDIRLAGEGEQTTHFSVIDQNGMAVANTYTLEASFGSHVVVRGGGFLLNNQMSDFNPRPDVTTRTGLIGTAANEIAPGKRMLSSMTPTIVTRNGRVYLITGSPGGRTIINTVLGIVLNVLEFEMSIRDAVDAPRLHHQWLPDVVRVEPALAKDHAKTLEKLREMGHTIERMSGTQGDAHSIRVDPRTDRYEGAADRRRGGWAAGY
jgi:gamma-glutamyltranspeptidase / glutathione hydrolase